MENVKQKTVSDLMLTCDKIIDDFRGTDGTPIGLDEAKTVLNAVGKKQKLIAIQIDYAKTAGIKINSKDFDFVYKPSK